MMRKLLLLLVLISAAFSSCRQGYVKNRFIIKSFEASFADSSRATISVKFNVDYCSDSSEPMGLVHKQMGMAGSYDSIEYFNFKIPQELQGEYNCITFDSFRNGYNRRTDGYIGQKFDFPYTFCTNKKGPKNNELILVLYHSQYKKTDTLHALIAPGGKY